MDYSPAAVCLRVREIFKGVCCTADYMEFGKLAGFEVTDEKRVKYRRWQKELDPVTEHCPILWYSLCFVPEDTEGGQLNINWSRSHPATVFVSACAELIYSPGLCWRTSSNTGDAPATVEQILCQRLRNTRAIMRLQKHRGTKIYFPSPQVECEERLLLC